MTIDEGGTVRAIELQNIVYEETQVEPPDPFERGHSGANEQADIKPEVSPWEQMQPKEPEPEDE